MCDQSLSTKNCSNIVNGERCKKGWHLKGTVPDSAAIPVSGVSGVSGASSVGNTDSMNGSQDQSQDFLTSLVRRELGIVFREIFQNPAPNPQSGRDYLWALMANKRM